MIVRGSGLVEQSYFRADDHGKFTYRSRVSKQMFPYIFRQASRRFISAKISRHEKQVFHFSQAQQSER
jgi:hypothetical protein